MKLPEFWKTGVLLLVLAGLGSYIWFVERKQEPKPEGEREKVTVLAVDKAKAKEISLAAAGGETIRLVKEGSALEGHGPLRRPRRHLGRRVDAHEPREARGGRGRGRAGGEPRRVRPRQAEPHGHRGGGGRAGARSPSSSAPSPPTGRASTRGRPARRRSTSCPQWVEGSFDKKPFDLRDRDLLHVKRDDVRSLEVVGPEGSYALARTDAGEWAFTKPVATRAGRWSVDGLLGTVENLRMESVAAEAATDVKPFGLDKPARTVSLVLKDGSTRDARDRRGGPGPHGHAVSLALPGEEGREAGAAEADEVLRPAGRHRPRGRGAGDPRRRPRQGHGRAAGEAAARGRDLRDRGLRGGGRRHEEGLREEHDQGQGRLRQDAVEAHRPRREGPRDDEGRGRALQDGRGRGVRVRGPAAGARDLRPRRARSSR